MSAPAARRYLRQATVLALLGGVAVAIVGIRAPGPWAAWIPGGWLAATVIGLAAGTALVRTHGRPDWGFLVALLGGMLARFVALGAGGVLAAMTGRGALGGYAAGFGIGFVPLQVHEAIFLRRESRGATLQSKVIG